MDKQMTEQELNFLVRAISQQMFKDHSQLIAAKTDAAKRCYAFGLIYANNTIRRLGLVDEVDHLTLDQFRGMTHNAAAEIDRQEWEEFTPTIL